MKLQVTKYTWFALCVLFLTACEESIQPIKVEGHKPKAYEQNPTDAVGVAEGDQQISPFGKPAH